MHGKNCTYSRTIPESWTTLEYRCCKRNRLRLIPGNTSHIVKLFAVGVINPNLTLSNASCRLLMLHDAEAGIGDPMQPRAVVVLVSFLA